MALWKNVALSLYSNKLPLAIDAVKTSTSIAIPQNVNTTTPLLKRF